MSEKRYTWHTVSFTPGANSFTAYYHNGADPAKPHTCVVDGWLTQKAVAFDSRTLRDVLSEDTDFFRIVAGVLDRETGEIESVDDNGCLTSFWQVLGPDDARPTEQQCAEACAEWRSKQEQRRQQRQAARDARKEAS